MYISIVIIIIIKVLTIHYGLGWYFPKLNPAWVFPGLLHVVSSSNSRHNFPVLYPFSFPSLTLFVCSISSQIHFIIYWLQFRSLLLQFHGFACYSSSSFPSYTLASFLYKKNNYTHILRISLYSVHFTPLFTLDLHDSELVWTSSFRQKLSFMVVFGKFMFACCPPTLTIHRTLLHIET